MRNTNEEQKPARAGAGAEIVCQQAGEEALWQSLKGRMAENLNPKRFLHSLEVADVSVDMGRVFGGDLPKLAIAGLLHDGAKDIGHQDLLRYGEAYALITDPAERLNPSLLHGPVAAWLACHEWGVEDPAILEAIRLHTAGDAGMSKEAGIVFMADLIEDGRNYEGVETLRRLCREDLQAAMIEAIEQTMVYLEHTKKPLHGGTVRCLAWLKKERGMGWKAKSRP
ncbi:MAG: bis(5'-nucleosyl)-tetraphosphatase (symmetrical) YqeK [Clostridiales bacterium]|nr:bis(5'-nucleosyl)-tetraphosphatase (symmetrical) YqeK [Clostridiales bacterium]